MDSRARIDYALFNLTPTRTRCDLVIFSNGQNEKLASGLLQPFVLHLKCAKEQMEKGGYSITLTPPTPAAWFTKGTLQRFVRFVNSPDVLERFVTIEKEIEQIEESIRSNELACEEVDANGKEAAADKAHNKTTSDAEINDESEGTKHVANKEHSKIQLQRVLETRKAVLHKEQAMVYARALVTGFQTNHLDGLVLFANTFGASRLREACYNFVKLCNKKNQDRLWIAEVVAMQASSPSQLSYSETSGIVLADDENGNGLHMAASAQVEGNGKPQPSSPWTNNYPQYFPNYYGPIHPHNMPPYQGYQFPGMHFGNPYYPGNMVTDPGNDHKSSAGKNKSSARKMEKVSKENVLDTSEEEGSTSSSSESVSGENVDCRKKHSSKKKTKRETGKKSSKRVVIRNVNYVRSKKDEDNEERYSDEEDLFDQDSIKQQIEEAVGSLHKHRRQKKQLEIKYASAVSGSNGFDLGNPDTRETEDGKVTETWGAFQIFLRRDQEINTNTVNRVQIENENFTSNHSEGSILSRKQIARSDSFIVNRNDRGKEGRVHAENLNAGDSFRNCVKNYSDTDEMLKLSRGNEDQENFIRITQSDYAARSAIVNSKSGEDWYVTHKNGSSLKDHNSDQKVLEGEYITFTSSSTQMDRAKNDLIDDSYMVHAQDHQYGSELKTDLSMVLDVTEATPYQTGAIENVQSKLDYKGTFEPDDLHMVLDRSSIHEPFSASWTPEIDYENIFKVSETAKNQSTEEPKAEDDGAEKFKGKAAPRPKALGGPLGKSKSDISSRSRKPALANKATVRKTKQDLEEERRVRMEELLIQRQKRIAERKSNSVLSAASNKETANIKSVNSEKSPLKSVVQDKKPAKKSSTINRLATPRISKQLPVVQSKTIQTSKASPKATGAPKKSVVNKTKKPASSQEKENHLDKKSCVDNSDSALSSKSDTSEKVDTAEISTLPEAEVVSSPAPDLAIESETKGKIPDGSEILASDVSDKKDALVLPIKVTYFPAPAPSVHDTEEVKELQIPRDENKEKVPSLDEEPISTEVVAAEEKNTSESVPSHVKASEKEQLSTEKGADTVLKSLSDGPRLAKDTDNVAPNRKQAKANSVTFSPTTKVAEIPASTPPSSFGFSPEHIPGRKKWDNNDYSNSNSAKVAKGFKKLLMFGRKSRPISYA